MLDLTAAGRDALLKRAVPAAAGLAALLALLALLTRSGGRGSRRRPMIVIEAPLLVVQTRPRGWRRGRKTS